MTVKTQFKTTGLNVEKNSFASGWKHKLFTHTCIFAFTVGEKSKVFFKKKEKNDKLNLWKKNIRNEVKYCYVMLLSDLKESFVIYVVTIEK